jgi:hypothetical protein
VHVSGGESEVVVGRAHGGGQRCAWGLSEVVWPVAVAVAVAVVVVVGWGGREEWRWVVSGRKKQTRQTGMRRGGSTTTAAEAEAVTGAKLPGMMHDVALTDPVPGWYLRPTDIYAPAAPSTLPPVWAGLRVVGERRITQLQLDLIYQYQYTYLSWAIDFSPTTLNFFPLSSSSPLRLLTKHGLLRRSGKSNATHKTTMAPISVNLPADAGSSDHYRSGRLPHPVASMYHPRPANQQARVSSGRQGSQCEWCRR